jgi:DNA polymerase I
MGENDRKTVMILDGNALLHRAYHAIPPFTTKEGVPTGAVYGFFSMLLKLIADLKPGYIAVTFDRPKPTFRQNLFIGYHANRPKMEDDLVVQIGIVHELLSEAGIQTFEVDGFEADDVIGTIVSRVMKESDLQTLIVSGDRDLLQLVGKRSFVLMPVIGISKMKLYGEDDVREKYDLEPLQIIDYKALAGDASDNYPGVHGIGPKTAVQLIKKYGSVEEMYKRIEDVQEANPKVAMKLAEGQEMAVLAKRLATILSDVPFGFSINKCSYRTLRRDNLIKALEKYEIRSLVKRVNEALPATPSKKTKTKNKQDGQLDLLN